MTSPREVGLREVLAEIQRMTVEAKLAHRIPAVTIAQMDRWDAVLRRHIEEDEARDKTVCVGYNTLRILAKEGAIFNLIAADDLYGTTPAPGPLTLTPEQREALGCAIEVCEATLIHAIAPINSPRISRAMEQICAMLEGTP